MKWKDGDVEEAEREARVARERQPGSRARTITFTDDAAPSANRDVFMAASAPDTGSQTQGTSAASRQPSPREEKRGGLGERSPVSKGRRCR